MVSFSDISAQPAMSNPSITLDPSFIGYLGYLSMGLISGVIFPILGHLEVSAQVIQGIWNLQRLKIVLNQIEIEKQNLALAEDLVEEYSIKIEQLAPDEMDQKLSKKMVAAEEIVQELLLKLGQLKEREVNLKVAIEDNKQKFIAAVFTLIPFLGVLGAGAYLKTTMPLIQENGLYGCAEALAQNVVAGYERLIHAMIYPLREKKSPLRIKFENSAGVIFGRNKFKTFNAEEVDVPVKRGDREGAISAYLIPNNITHSFDSNRPVMVVFHGNGQTKETMFYQTEFYLEKGFNVMAVTMGGYPGSDEEVLTSEISTYQDANAVINYLKKEGFDNIGVHGTSIGGTLAFAAAELHPDVVKLVVADQTLGMAKDVGANLMRNLSEGLLPEALIRGGIGGAFRAGIAVPGVVDSNDEPYVTDGLNNIRKANVLRDHAEKGLADCHVFAIKAKKDMFMGRIKNDEGFEENFADDLIMARYGNLDSHITELLGEHCSWFTESSEEEDLSNELDAIFFFNS